MKQERFVLDEERNVTLTAYLHEEAGSNGYEKRPAVLIMPGGGYEICADSEADPPALAYARAGYQAFVLRYSVGKHFRWPLPLADYEAAAEMIEKNSEKWMIDMSGFVIMGFSAGGHLAASALTLSEYKPAAAVLIYPVIYKYAADKAHPGMPDPIRYVTKDTCPCFLAAARDDPSVDIRNTLTMELVLTEKGVPFESHIYSFGGHAFSTADEWLLRRPVSRRVHNWVDDSLDWLKETLSIGTE